MKKVILDTDIGTDIDDAVCLAYLLANPECDLLGITTVTGEAALRAEMASALCRVVDRQIPILPGAELPLLIAQQQRTAAQAAALGDWPRQRSFPEHEAVDFLRRTIRQHPGEVTLLTIGPLTNLGLLFALDPEIPSLLADLVMMCGAFTLELDGRIPAEWNAKGDPHATAIAYRHAAPRHRSVGLDVTRQVKMSATEVRQRFAVPLLQPVLDFAEVWFQHRPEITFHDPLAAAVIFAPDLCGFSHGQVTVELGDQQRLGTTHWQPADGGPHEVALRVEPDRFFDHFFSVLR